MTQETKLVWLKKHPVVMWLGGLVTVVVGAVLANWGVTATTDLKPVQAVWLGVAVAWDWLWGDVTVPAWIFVPSVAAVCFLCVCGGRVAWRRSQSRRAEPEPAWKRYTSDVFLDLEWELKFYDGRLKESRPLCPECRGLLSMVADGHYRCSCCPKQYHRTSPSGRAQDEYIGFESDRRLRNGDWKQAGERVAKFRAKHGRKGGDDSDDDGEKAIPVPT